MTPAIDLARKKKVFHAIHEYEHDVASESYGLEAAEKLKISSKRVFKTLVVSLTDKSLAVGVVPVSSLLNMKAIAKTLGSKKAAMADQSEVERSTGYILGGVGPLGQKKRLPTVIDSSARQFETIFVSAGRRGLEIELNPNDLKKLVNGNYADIS